jgi:Uma2 family endonuclease
MSTAQRYTSADLLAFPDNDGKRYEIIAGDLHVSKQPHAYHQLVCFQLGFELRRMDSPGAGRVLTAPGLIFAEDDDVVPDVVWIRESRLAIALQPDGKLHSAPELVAEVLSPGATNERRDREAKLDIYSRHSVAEYWIVDWRRQRIEVFRGQGDRLMPAAIFEASDALTSPLFPGRSGRASEVFAGTIPDAPIA